MGLPVVAFWTLLSAIGGEAFRRKAGEVIEVERRLKVQAGEAERADSLKVKSNASFFEPVWITLGDSFASGMGIHTAHSDYDDGARSFGCYRDWTNVPGAKYAAYNHIAFFNEACAFTYLAGVETQLRKIAAKFPLDTQNKWKGSIFQLTTGGNDLRTVRGETWETLLMRCVTNSGDCSRDPQNQVTNWKEVELNLTSLFTKVAEFGSGARVRIVGYPRLMTFKFWCFNVPGMSGADANWIDSMVDTLNGHVLSAVTHAKKVVPDVDMEFVDITNFITRGACSWTHRQINGLVFSIPEGVSHATLHPQQSGYDAVFTALTANLR